MSQLFTPFFIGQAEIHNRIISSATVECLTDENNKLTEQYYKVYERLAKNNVGLIIPGNYFITANGRVVDKVMVIDNDEVIQELFKLTEKIHSHGGRIIAQINHGGRQCDPKLIGERPMSPSGVRDKLTRIKPRTMTPFEISSIIDAFAKAAKRVQLAGFDGVQINAAHGYLINQFLSARANKRKDNWGGSLNNRMRFLMEVYKSIRAEVGFEFPVLVKINSEDQIKNGVSIEESIRLCLELEKMGLDAVEVSGGIKETGFATTKGFIPKKEILKKYGIIKSLFFLLIENKLRKKAKFEEGYFVHFANMIKKEVSIPVIVTGGIRSKEFAEKILIHKQADFVAMSRPFIRQPNLVRKFENAENDYIATCKNCNICTVEITQNYRPLKCYYKK